MASPSASVLYKKQDGILALSRDRSSVTWTLAQPGATASINLDVSKITNLQQTPADKPKVMLKIFYSEPGQAEASSHIFQFSSKSDPRGEANFLRDALSTAMAKASQAALAAPGGQSAAMTIAAAISGRGARDWEDDERLVTDVKLQQALLKENADLQRTFMEARSLKPESLSLIQFTKQFWASRVHLLRAHALATSQSKGLYNVFSEIKRTGEGSKQLNLTSEHIKAIFEQYPIMRIVYDEVVPKKISDERQFWSRFFQSQLYSTLRGLKVDRRAEAKDAIMDLYLDHPEITGVRATSSELHIPKFIDLEGNEENHSQRKGNRPDAENRQSTLEKGPIIRRLNAISEKLMAAVRPSDTDVSAPIGIDESEYEQLRLRDLAIQEDHQRIALNIRDQSHLFSDDRTAIQDAEVARMRSVDAAKAIQQACSRLQSSSRTPLIEFDEDEDMEEESISGTAIANDHILSLIKSHKEQSAEAVANTNLKTFGGLSEAIYERLILTHATTLEFLRQFWSAFLSGDPTRTQEIASLVESLNRALDRINNIATDAQGELDQKIKVMEAQIKGIFERTGRKQKINRKAMGGGEEVVRQLMAPTIKSLGVAVEKYKTTYEEQMRQQGLLTIDD